MKQNCAGLLIAVAMVVFFGCPMGSLAWDESPKTLWEKREKDAEKQIISAANIKRKVTYKHEVVDGKLTDRRILVVLEDFDRKGRLTAVETYWGFSLKNRFEFSYDAAGNMIEGKRLGPVSKLEEKAILDYDGEGRIRSGQYLDDAGSVRESFLLSRRQQDKEISLRRHKGKNVLLATVHYFYPGDPDTTACRLAENLDDQNKLISKSDLFHDASGHPVEQIVYGPDGKELHRFSYEYDRDGNNIRITKTGRDGAAEWIEKFIYYKKGICVERQKYNSKNKLESVLKFEYEYFSGEDKK